MQNSHTWVVVLAAGDGKRLSALTADDQGRHVPKQYCSLYNDPSLFGLALQRAQSLVSTDRICAVVAREHERWWRPLAAAVHDGNLIVQPRNRGTGNGVLLALSSILGRDPLARLIFLPADHHVLDEAVLNLAMHTALDNVTTGSRGIVLLGIEPDDPDPGLGYVIPQETCSQQAQGVRHFVEKPSWSVARKLIQGGGLWNSGIVAVYGESLMARFKQLFLGNTLSIMGAMAKMHDPMAPSWALSHLYDRISDIDFSHHVLQRSVNDLRVVRVPHCGWTDLGTPGRVAERVNMLSATVATAAPRPRSRRRAAAYLSLAEAVSRIDSRCVSSVIH